jgi:hypothetical protein
MTSRTTPERGLQADAGSGRAVSTAANAGERGAERPRERPVSWTEEQNEDGVQS